MSPAATEHTVVVANAQTEENVIGMAEATVLLMLAALYDLDGAQDQVRKDLWRPPQLKAQPVARQDHRPDRRSARSAARPRACWRPGARTCNTARAATPISPACRRCRGSISILCCERATSSWCWRASIAETRGLIGAEKLRLMKKTAILVNTARGAIVDEAALAEAMKSKAIAGAAIDCFAVEPLPADSPLRGLPNVILTPHMIGHTVEAHHSLEVATRENLDLDPVRPAAALRGQSGGAAGVDEEVGRGLARSCRKRGGPPLPRALRAQALVASLRPAAPSREPTA